MSVANLPSPALYDLAKKELALWRQVGATLAAVGAIAEEDREVGRARFLDGRDIRTPGQRLLDLIHEWGAARAALHVAIQKEADERGHGR